MGKGIPLTPEWAHSLADLVKHADNVRAFCSDCRQWKFVDLQAMMAIKGPQYSLMNRRCRCRITVGCKGWNWFTAFHGAARVKLYDQATERRRMWGSP